MISQRTSCSWAFPLSHFTEDCSPCCQFTVTQQGIQIRFPAALWWKAWRCLRWDEKFVWWSVHKRNLYSTPWRHFINISRNKYIYTAHFLLILWRHRSPSDHNRRPRTAINIPENTYGPHGALPLRNTQKHFRQRRNPFITSRVST